MKLFVPRARAALIVAALLVCSGEAAAQEKRDATPPLPTGLSIEVNTKEGPLGYQSVPGESFGGRYRRLADWKPAPGSAQPRSFRLWDALEGDAVRVKVFAQMDKFHERELLIGDFALREGERAVVEGMARYGYEPMELTVVRVRPAPFLVPVATSRVPSVGVVGVEPRATNFPSYKLTLRNLSHKQIVYMEIQSYKSGVPSTVHWPRGERNVPLMKAGETYETNVSSGGGGAKADDGVALSSPHTVKVLTVVFDDKSYEGDEASAARFLANLRGQKTQAARSLVLFERAALSASLESLLTEATALGREADKAAVEEVLKEFPGLPPQANEYLEAFMEHGLDSVRKELLKDIRRYEKEREGARAVKPFGAWLAELREKYEAWLSRL